MNTPIGENMCNLSCARCGHEADIGEFWQTEMRGQLPPNHFQCPKCHCAWRIEITPIIRTRWGGMISEPNKIVYEQTSL